MPILEHSRDQCQFVHTTATRIYKSHVFFNHVLALSSAFYVLGFEPSCERFEVFASFFSSTSVPSSGLSVGFWRCSTVVLLVKEMYVNLSLVVAALGVVHITIATPLLMLPFDVSGNQS